VVVRFDGSGVTALGDTIIGACEFCAKSHNVLAPIRHELSLTHATELCTKVWSQCIDLTNARSTRADLFLMAGAVAMPRCASEATVHADIVIVVFSKVTVPTTLQTRDGEMTLRYSELGDIDTILQLLADDPVSALRGDTARPEDRPAYEKAFHAIATTPANALLVVVAASGDVVATMQLTAIPGMARRGSHRLQVEAVRVAASQRSSGIGGAMMRWVVQSAAPTLGASLVQLTSDEARTDAHRFYTKLGFEASHIGFKYSIKL